MVTVELWKVSGIEGRGQLYCGTIGCTPTWRGQERAPAIRNWLPVRLHRWALEEERRHRLPQKEGPRAGVAAGVVLKKARQGGLFQSLSLGKHFQIFILN